MFYFIFSVRNNDIPEKSKPTEIKSAKNLENNSVEDPKIMKEVTSLEQIKDISNDAKINPKDLEGRKMSKSKIPTDEKTKQNQSRLNTNKVKNTLRNNL